MVFGDLVILNNDQDNQNGTLPAIAATAEFKQLGHTKLGDTCRNNPAIAAGKRFIRPQSKLCAIRGACLP